MEIYCFTTEIERHNGYCKIGKTARTAEQRVHEEVRTSNTECTIHWSKNTDYGNGRCVTDNEFRNYLYEKGYERLGSNTEFVKISPEEAEKEIDRYMNSLRAERVNQVDDSHPVYMTNDYDIFKRLEGNRAVSETRVKIIQESIRKVSYICNPIIVNEKMEVIDGQGRLEACRREGIMVRYIIEPNIGREEMKQMNRKNTSWKESDFIGHHLEIGTECFVKLNDIIEEYNSSLKADGLPFFKLSMRTAYDVLKNLRHDGGEFGKALDTGFEVNDAEFESLRNILEKMRRFSYPITMLKSKRERMFIHIAWTLRNIPGIDEDRFFDKFSLSVNTRRVVYTDTFDENLMIWDKIYNDSLARSKRVNFEDYLSKKSKARTW